MEAKRDSIPWLCLPGHKQICESGQIHTYNLIDFTQYLNPPLLLEKDLLFFMVSVRGQQISRHPLLSEGSFQFGDPKVAV